MEVFSSPESALNQNSLAEKLLYKLQNSMEIDEEIEKLYRKHHRLMGYEKKTKVVQSLMRKGFSYDDISTVYERICEELEDE